MLSRHVVPKATSWLHPQPRGTHPRPRKRGMSLSLPAPASRLHALHFQHCGAEMERLVPAQMRRMSFLKLQKSLLHLNRMLLSLVLQLMGRGRGRAVRSSDDCTSHAELLPCEGSGVGGEQKSLGTLREGVLHPLEGMLLLATGQPLCVPVTQDPGPLTEDMMAEQEQVLARLGTSEEAARVRARLQAGSLLSDMQAFKASRHSLLCSQLHCSRGSVGDVSASFYSSPPSLPPFLLLCRPS